MTDRERVATIKSTWEALPPKWDAVCDALRTAPSDILFLCNLVEDADQGLRLAADTNDRLRAENERLRGVVRRWTDESVDAVLENPPQLRLKRPPALPQGEEAPDSH